MIEVERSSTGDWTNIDINDIAAQFLFIVPRKYSRATTYSEDSPRNNRRRLSSTEKKTRYFCSPFNQGRCKHSNKHKGVVFGKLQTVEHICAACLMNLGEGNKHPETNCPKGQVRRKRRRSRRFSSQGDQGAVGGRNN